MHKTLTVRTEVPVRFNEADPWALFGMGTTSAILKTAGEAFGAQYGLTYLDFYKNGLVVPIVNIDCSYKKPLRYGDKVIVETTYHNLKAAKILFKYKLFHAQNGDLVATGSSVQVFLDHKTNHLHLNNPSFFESWKHKNGLPA